MVVVIMSVLAVAILPSLGKPGSVEGSLPAGTIGFGITTYPHACGVADPAMAITSTSQFDAVGHLVRAASAGENLTSAVTFPDGHITSTDQVMENTASCIIQKARDLGPGHYIVEFRVGTEVLARGEVTIAS